MNCLLFSFVFATVLLVAPSTSEESKETESTVAYVKASLPNQIFRCIQKFNLLRCLKYFVLLRLETREYLPETKESTSEFLGSIMQSEQNLPQDIPERFLRLSDDELNKKLTDGFQRFFANRPIVLRFIPNMLVKIVPSKSNDLEFNIKKFDEKDFAGRAKKDSDEDDDDDEDEKEEITKDETTPEEADKGAMRKKSQYLQVGLPLLLAPAMVFAGFLPMLIPVLKLATAFTTIVNSFALLSAIAFLARQHALDRETQSTIYFNPGYKE